MEKNISPAPAICCSCFASFILTITYEVLASHLCRLKKNELIMVQWPRTGICGWYRNWVIVWFQGPASLHYTHWSLKKEGIRGGSAHPFVREGLAAAATGFLTVRDSSSLRFLWVSELQKEHSWGAGSLSRVSIQYHLDLFHLGKTVIIPPTPQHQGGDFCG